MCFKDHLCLRISQAIDLLLVSSVAQCSGRLSLQLVWRRLRPLPPPSRSAVPLRGPRLCPVSQHAFFPLSPQQSVLASQKSEDLKTNLMSAAQRSITESWHYFGSANVASHVPSYLAWDLDDLLLQFIVLFCVVCVPTDCFCKLCDAVFPAGRAAKYSKDATD